jgi:hypothetical protein
MKRRELPRCGRVPITDRYVSNLWRRKRAMSALLMFGQSTMSASPVREGCARTCRVLVNTTAFEQSRRNFKRAEMRSPLSRSTYVGLLSAGHEVSSAFAPTRCATTSPGGSIV